MILIPVLKNNRDITELKEKLEEEKIELEKEIDSFEKCRNEENAGNIVEEALDVIQVAVGVVDIILENYPKETREKFKEHLPKLHNRGWRFKKILSIEES
ncbi:hypothetical protein [Anaerophilus nitritogenes]|uniref:hypothetical protein n=1 Tax=Anaerophilus nitritogenes TaxID=2498136 RepID=UPI00101C5712|nr:hypothetical protein [Anaerophilus nitritogenes]